MSEVSIKNPQETLSNLRPPHHQILFLPAKTLTLAFIDPTFKAFSFSRTSLITLLPSSILLKYSSRKSSK